jgi:hypothetical protein
MNNYIPDVPADAHVGSVNGLDSFVIIPVTRTTIAGLAAQAQMILGTLAELDTF